MGSENLGGLAVVNLELTSRCNKACWMCGRRKIERDYPDLANWGDIPIELAIGLSVQIPDGIIVQFHNNGEPLLYPKLPEVLDAYKGKMRCFDTNGKLLVKRWHGLQGNCEVITVSVFQGDAEADKQYKILEALVGMAGPRIVLRCLGDINLDCYKQLGFPIITRTLHDPLGSFHYTKCATRPEYDICLDLLTHLSIDRFGKVRPCVRFDPKDENIIGDATTTPLIEIWAGKRRREYLSAHIAGKRAEIPFCGRCEYWGIPVG